MSGRNVLCAIAVSGTIPVITTPSVCFIACGVSYAFLVARNGSDASDA
jgi:hypothetical protein